MGLKGIKTINRTLNKFLAPFECTARMGTEFCYLYSQSLILYSFVMPDLEIEHDFQASIDRLNPTVKMDSFLWGLLHELGHHETMDEIEETEYNYCQQVKEQINNQEVDAVEYYDLIDERLATEWAVRYADAHALELKKWWEEEMQPAIMHFYKINNVEIEG